MERNHPIIDLVSKMHFYLTSRENTIREKKGETKLSAVNLNILAQ